MTSANTDLRRGRADPDAARTLTRASLYARSRTLARAVRVFAFWVAVGMPPAHLAVVFAGPLAVADVATLATLVCVNVLALVVGHGHGADG